MSKFFEPKRNEFEAVQISATLRPFLVNLKEHCPDNLWKRLLVLADTDYFFQTPYAFVQSFQTTSSSKSFTVLLR